MVELRMDPLIWLRKQLEEADVDLLREMVRSFAENLMSAEADALCGASYGERSEDRVNRRNGYRERDLDTRAGTIELRVPKLRQGSYYPEWLFERRRRAERALIAVICECYVRGVSTRRVDGLVKALGMEGISKSQVSAPCKTLDAEVAAFRSRPLSGGLYAYLWLDAMTVKAREEGRVTSVATVVATAVSADGHREILGLDTFTAEDGAAWTRFLRDLWPEGYPGCVWLSPTTTRGLVGAIAAVLPGCAWQRCRTHFMRNALCRVPRSVQPFVATLIRTIFAQPSAQEVQAQLRRVIAQLEGWFPDVGRLLEEAGPDITVFSSFPVEHWKQIWSNNLQERLNREIRRRSDVVGIFPDRASIIRLVGAVLAEQPDEWQVARRYMSQHSLERTMEPSAVVAGLEEEVVPLLMMS